MDQKIKFTDKNTGLSGKEVKLRIERGYINTSTTETGRSYKQIFWENGFTFINVLLGAIALLLIFAGKISDGVIYFCVAALNVIVGLVQEINSKRKLDSITSLISPKTLVLRDSAQSLINAGDLVLGDIVIIKSGELISADCIVVSGSFEMDESLLTGESDLIKKTIGGEILAGSSIQTGSGIAQVIRVGGDTMAAKISSKAKNYSRYYTPVQKEVNLTIRVLVLIATALGLMVSMLTVINDIPYSESIQIAAVVLGIVPNSLFAMINLAYALGGLNVLKRGALVQKLNAIESMANVDVLCLDKTGTLTTKNLKLEDIEVVSNYTITEISEVLGKYAATTTDRNATSDAIFKEFGNKYDKFTEITEEVPFNSAYKWSGFLLGNSQALIIGGGDILISHNYQTNPNFSNELSKKINVYQDLGLRVLVLASSQKVNSLFSANGSPKLPDKIEILAIMVFSDEIRENVIDTLREFKNAGVMVKIISGDNPKTVAGLAKQINLFEHSDPIMMLGDQIKDYDLATLGDLAIETDIFGRITPDQKELLVQALMAKGKYVAMIGDGVNDVMSLKMANLGIAMESGSQTTKSVSDIVLLGDSFASLPASLIEGQKIRNGLQDIFKLYLTRIIYLILLYIAVLIVQLPFPFTVKQSSLIATFSAGIPAIGLSLWSQGGKLKDKKLVQSVLVFVLPAAILTATFAICLLFGMSLFELSKFPDSGITNFFPKSIENMQTALTIFLILSSQFLVLFIKPPHKFFSLRSKYQFDKRNSLLSLTLGIGFLLLYTIPAFRKFWDLTLISPNMALLILACVCGYLVSLYLAWKYRIVEKFLDLE